MVRATFGKAPQLARMPFLQVKFLQESEEGLEIAMLFETSQQTTLKTPWRVPGHQARSGEFEWRSPVQRIATIPSHGAVALACIAALDTTDNTGALLSSHHHIH